MRIAFFLLLFVVHFTSFAQEPEGNSEDSLLLNESDSESDSSDFDDIDNEDDVETVYLDEFKRNEYGDLKYRVQVNGGYNTKPTASGVNPGPEEFQSASPYYRLGIVYLAQPVFPSSSFARMFSWGLDAVYSKSVSGRQGAYSESRIEERNTILAPKLYAETALLGLNPNVFVHFAFVFNFYLEHETRLVTSHYTTKLKSPKYKENIFSSIIFPALEIGLRYQLTGWSILLQGDTFQGEGNNPWGSFALSGGAVYDF